MLPLSDVRVLDLTNARAGPTCVRQFADWGADVIRVEPRASRQADLGQRHGSDFQSMHRNKRSLALNLKDQRERDVFYKLVRKSDIVIENMRPQTKDRLKVDYETLRGLNPRLVYGSISGFGQDGPIADRGGVDQIAQGIGGLMSVTGQVENGPVRAGFAVTDVTSGLILAIGVLVALHARDRTGEGAWVQTSLLEAAITQLDFQAARWLLDGEVPAQAGNHHPTMVPMGCYATADGHLNVAAWDGLIWEAFLRVIGATEIISHPRFTTSEDRSAHRDELHEIIEARLRTKPTAEWIPLFDAVHVPAGPVNRVDEVFAEPQVHHLSLVQELEHPRLGTQRLVKNALSISGASREIRRPSPELGEHNLEIMADLGLEEST